MGFIVYTYFNEIVVKSQVDALSPVSVGRSDGLNQTYQVDLNALKYGEHSLVSATPQIIMVYYDSQCDFRKTIILQQKETYPIGRAADSSIVLKTKQVSSKHALLSYTNSGWVLEDMGSTNGIYINGAKVQQRLLQDDDVIHIAGWEFEYKEGTIRFTSTLGVPAFNFSPTFAVPEKREIKYPEFSRVPRIKTKPVSKDYDFIPPGYKQGAMQGSLRENLLAAAPGALMSVFTGNPLPLLFSGMSMAVSAKKNAGQKKSAAMNEQKRVEDYNTYLDALEKEMKELVATQSRLLHSVNPGIKVCLAIAEERKLRLWERSVFDHVSEDDYLSIRMGLGKVDSGLNILLPRENLSASDDELLQKPKEFAAKYARIQDAPITMNLKESPTVGIIGARDRVINCVNSMVMNIAVHHPYDEVKIVCLCNEHEHWEWMRWLPHTWNDDKTYRYMASTRQDAKELLREFDEMLKSRQKEIDDHDRYNNTVKLPYYIFVIADKSLADNSTIMRQLLSNNPYLA